MQAWHEGGRGVLVQGSPGCGKTRLMQQALQAMVAQGRNLAVTTIPLTAKTTVSHNTAATCSLNAGRLCCCMLEHGTQCVMIRHMRPWQCAAPASAWHLGFCWIRWCPLLRCG